MNGEVKCHTSRKLILYSCISHLLLRVLVSNQLGLIPYSQRSTLDNSLKEPAPVEIPTPFKVPMRMVGRGSTALLLLVESKNAILLQTAKGYISPPAISQPTAIVRIIFDSGSQRSYISAKLRLWPYQLLDARL